MKQRTKDSALKIIDNMVEMIEAERLRGGDYVFDVDDPGRVTAICGGRKHCLLGTAWVAAGQVPVRMIGSRLVLLGVGEYQRAAFLARRPALRLVYDELNNAAMRKIQRNLDYRARWAETQRANMETGENDVYGEFCSAAEGLFETEHLSKADVLALVRSARKVIEKIEVEA